MDPINKDAANIQIIPMGWTPVFYEKFQLYAQVRDSSGHFRRNIPVSIPSHNFLGHIGVNDYGHILTPFAATDDLGVTHCHLETAGQDDGKSYPVGGAYLEKGFRHYLSGKVTVSGVSNSDTIYFITRHLDNDPIKIISGNNQSGYPEMRGGELVVKSEQFAGTYGYPNQLVTFTALPAEGATPSGFKNARMSEKFTLGYAPYELPAEGAFQSDDRGDCKKSVTVMTDDLGYARAVFYLGNTDNFTYRIKAQVVGEVGDGSSVEFTESIQDYEYIGGYHLYAPNYHYKYGDYNYYLAGEPVEFSVFDDRIDPIACVDTTCSYRLTPAEDSFWTWYSWLEGESPSLGGTVRTDLEGRAEAEVEIPAESVSRYFNFGWDAGTWGIDIQHTVVGVAPADIYFWKMQRRDKNFILHTLNDGGTVQATDMTIEVEFFNMLSKYLQIVVTKGGSRLKAKGVPYWEGGYVVNPGATKMIFYLVHDPNAPPGTEFEFVLRDPQTGMEFDRKGGEFEIKCDIYKVIIELSKIDANYGKWKTMMTNNPAFHSSINSLCRYYAQRQPNYACADLASDLELYINNNRPECCEAYLINPLGLGMHNLTGVKCFTCPEWHTERIYDPYFRLFFGD